MLDTGTSLKLEIAQAVQGHLAALARAAAAL